jgi:dUTPase
MNNTINNAEPIRLNQDFHTFIKTFKNNSAIERIMYIDIFVDDDDTTLKQLYIDAAEKHNKNIIENMFFDAGFDLFLPKNDYKYYIEGDGTLCFLHKVNKIDFKVKCCAQICKTDNFQIRYYTPFYTYARSSISKTPLRLANNQGIIDAGYRGNLIGMFDCLKNENNAYSVFNMEEYSRILQICSPELLPIYVNIVDKLEDLGPTTSRGDGGFGSTGK